jgi:hypothetical protein
VTLAVADLAYAAALVDTLAALRTRKVGPSELPVVQVSGRVDVTAWLAEVTGTKVIPTHRKYNRMDCVEHCPERHTHIVSESGRWEVNGARATIMLIAIEPYLRVKGAEARRLIDFGLASGYKTNVINDMATRGWPIPELREQPRARLARVG